MTYFPDGRLATAARGVETVELTWDHEGSRVVTRRIGPQGEHVEYIVEGLYFVASDGARRTVVWLDDWKVAEIAADGTGLVLHVDRLNNTNVVSNLATGAFAGQVEYTPYGRVSVALRIDVHFGFQQGCRSAVNGLVHLGDRCYDPATGRFTTLDRWLLDHPARSTLPILSWNLYLYAGGNPVNFIDPSGHIISAIIGAAIVVGIISGLIGAATNGARTWDEWLVSIVAGVVGAVSVTLIGFFAGGIWGAAIFLSIFTTFSWIGTPLTRLLDQSTGPLPAFATFIIKWVQSPFFTTVGLFVAIGFLIAGHDLDYESGALFINVGGQGRGAITLGAFVYARAGNFSRGGDVNDDFARHEGYHTRQVVAFGELGFYLTYITLGALWGQAEAGEPGSTDAMGCGNPFEKTARTFNHPAPATPTGTC
jgi:RHS repeat-associated protein